MGKISLVSAKYIIHASIEIKGAVDRPDVIGAIFGQTEGLLGSDLELRELQRSGRIGRIEVKVDTQGGVTRGSIIIPSSLDKAETSIVGAALEIIQRIGPCDSKLVVDKIEDVRISKRGFVVGRAKQLLKHLTENVLPDSKELAEEVAHSVRVMEIQDYGADRLPAGPGIDESDEVIVVEGRADVLNLLKHGIKNAIAMNGTSVPQTVRDLSKKKLLTAFVDGDRGGDLIVKELMAVADIDFVTKAPDGKEVEELSKKEIFNAFRKKVDADKVEIVTDDKKYSRPALKKEPLKRTNGKVQAQPQRVQRRPVSAPSARKIEPSRRTSSPSVTDEDKEIYRDLLEEIIGSRAAMVLDEDLEVLGKVPLTELASTIKNLENVHAVVFDGAIDQPLLDTAESSNLKCIVGMDKKVRDSNKVAVLTLDDL
ncbi:DNA primase [Candidatus Woesearchaeota archaeon]|nr:DNA primase [Candidatus Woesearchaeota archaeon]